MIIGNTSKINLILIILLFILTFNSNCYNANNISRTLIEYEFSIKYDARLFLTEEQRILFNSFFPRFNSNVKYDEWEWQDVDPLKLLTPEENRFRRREHFLFEITPQKLPNFDNSPTQNQIVFGNNLKKIISNSDIFMTDNTIKINLKFDPKYDIYFNKYYLSNQAPNILKLTATLGLEWIKIGGTSLYFYNGSILISKFYVGYVILVNQLIDK